MKRPADRAVLLPATGRRRRRRGRGSLGRAIWIASAILMGCLAAIALDEASWVEQLVDEPDARPPAPEAPAAPYGPGNLGLPPLGRNSAQPPPPP